MTPPTIGVAEHPGKLHRTIALVGSEKFQDLAETQPELLAYHYTKAGIDAEAVSYWERAARRAASRSAQIGRSAT